MFAIRGLRPLKYRSSLTKYHRTLKNSSTKVSPVFERLIDKSITGLWMTAARKNKSRCHQTQNMLCFQRFRMNKISKKGNSHPPCSLKNPSSAQQVVPSSLQLHKQKPFYNTISMIYSKAQYSKQNSVKHRVNITDILNIFNPLWCLHSKPLECTAGKTRKTFMQGINNGQGKTSLWQV